MRENVSEIVVCLTTIPSRVRHLAETLDSLLKQTLPPKYIFLFLPKWSTKEQCVYPSIEIPISEKIIIQITDDDYGPLTKMYPLLVDVDPSLLENIEFVILVDDDKRYHERMIEEMVFHQGTFAASLHKTRNLIGIGFGGWIMNGWIHVTCGEGIECDWLETTNGAMYPLSLLQNAKPYLLLQKKLCANAFYCDDIWIGGWVKECTPNSKLLCVPFRNKCPHQVSNNSIHTNTQNANVNALRQNIYEMKQTSVNEKCKTTDVFFGAAKTQFRIPELHNVITNVKVARQLRDRVFKVALRCPKTDAKESVHIQNRVIFAMMIVVLFLLLLIVIAGSLMNKEAVAKTTSTTSPVVKMSFYQQRDDDQK